MRICKAREKTREASGNGFCGRVRFPPPEQPKKTDEEMSKEELVKWMREADDIMVPTQRSAEKWDYTPLLPDVQPAVLTLQANEK